MRPPILRLWLAATRRPEGMLALLLLLLLVAGSPDAAARVGGGQSYGGGSSGGGYSGGSSSSSGGDLGLLIWLVFEYPTVGIPLILVVMGLVVWQNKVRHSQPSSYRPRYDPVPLARRPTWSPEVLQRADAHFSEPAFLDFAQLVFARIHQERPKGRLDKVAAYLSPAARAQLDARGDGLEEVKDVVFGVTRVESGRVAGPSMELVVRFEANLTEVRKGTSRQLLVTETWGFRKSSGALSPAPKALTVLACPSCGNPTETRTDGSCVHCDTPIGRGQLLWEVQYITLLSAGEVQPPPLSLLSGEEAGTHLPTVFQPDFGARIRSFQARHPEFDPAAFKRRVLDVFLALQTAWDAGKWEDARPYETDSLFQSHRYWMERYARFQLRNRLEKVEVLDIVPCKVGRDAFFDSITVRIRARMVDYTVDGNGKVVGGHRTRPRTFTEYWTFLRSSGASAATSAHGPRQCPSCGAPLDKVSQSGVCGYCGARITSGEHDWVLSAIEQDDAYRG